MQRFLAKARACPGRMRISLAALFCVFAAFSRFRPKPRRALPPDVRRLGTKGLAEPFKGITTNGTVEPGLFPVQLDRRLDRAVRKAAEAFLAALTQEQRAKTTFPVDDPEWRKWMNQHFYVRQGVSFLEMNSAQRDAAFGLRCRLRSARAG